MAKLIVLFVTAFVDMIGLAMVLPLLPFYAAEMGASATTVGILVSAFSVAQLAVAPAWGRLSDNYGRRPAILLGLIVTSVAYLLFGLADTIGVLLLSRVVQGLGGGTIGVVQAYVTDVSEPSNRTKNLGWLSAVTSLGAVVGPAIGSLLVTVGGQRAPGFAAAAFAALVAVFAWKALEEARDVSEDAPSTEKPSTSLEAIRHIITKWREPAPRLIWIYTIAIGGFYGTVPIMPLLFAERLGITESSIGYIIMYLGGMGVIVRMFLLGKLVDRFGERRLSRAGIVMLAAGLALLGAVDSYPLLIASITLMPLGTAFLFPANTAQLSRVVSSRERGLYMGVQQTFGGASRVVFPLGVGMAMDVTGLGIPFYGTGVLVLLTLPLTRGVIRFRTSQASIAVVEADEPDAS